MNNEIQIERKNLMSHYICNFLAELFKNYGYKGKITSTAIVLGCMIGYIVFFMFIGTIFRAIVKCAWGI